MNQGTFVFAPRNGDTGARVPSSARIDNLEFLVSGLPWEIVVERFLGLSPSEFERVDSGLRGYSKRVRRGGVQVLYDKMEAKGQVKVLVGGQGVDELGVDAVELVCKVLVHNQGLSAPVKSPVSQIHVAIDDRSGTLNRSLVSDAVLSGQLVTKFREFQRISGFHYEDGSVCPDGETWYFGSFKGDRYVRAYDKQAERIGAGEPDPGPWYRFEIQARRRAATMLALAIAENGLSSAGGILRGMIDFRECDNDRENRRSIVEWWLGFCDGLVAIRTGVKRIPATLQRVTRWLEYAVSRRLAEVHTILGDGWLQGLISLGSRKIDPGAAENMAREAGFLPFYRRVGDRLSIRSEVAFCPF